MHDQTLALTVSGGVAAGWLFGAALVGWVCAVMFWPPIIEWWWRTLAVTRLGFEYVIYGAGILALAGGAIWLISRTVYPH